MNPSDGTGYDYYRSRNDGDLHHRNVEAAIELGKARLHPSPKEPDYLVHRERARIFREWSRQIPDGSLTVLDVGGRIQPYRSVLADRVGNYYAIDLQLHGLVDVVAQAEGIPFRSGVFDVVLCTQVLSYVQEPARVLREIRRVLKPGGCLFLSAPAFFPRHHDERWRFLPDGLSTLAAGFRDVRVEPEGGSIAGISRTICIGLHSTFTSRPAKVCLRHLVNPIVNTLGSALDRFSRGNTTFTANYCLLARR